MSEFQPILDAALARMGGTSALAARLPEVKSAAELRAVADDRYLSLMSLRVFRAGLKHSMVDAKWPAFEDAFHGFAPRRVRAMSDEDIEGLLGDKRLIRHGGKLRAVRDNAAAMCALADETGGCGAYLADWPADDAVGLWDDLAKRFSHVGGSSGPYFLRMVGKDTWRVSPDVVKALNRFGAYDGTGKGKREARRLQEVFNGWAEETGRPLAHLSMIAALSVD